MIIVGASLLTLIHMFMIKNSINSQSFVHDINSRPSHLTIEQRLIQNANRIEWKQWFNLLNLSSFYAHLKNDGTWIMTKNVYIKSSLDGSVVSPDKKNLNCQNSQELSLNFHHSMDFNFNELKNDFSYGNPQNQRESLLNNSTNYKVSGVNISLQWGEKDSKPKLTKSKPRICNISHSLQNSAKKIPFSDRLDSTENLQIKPSDKSDNIIDESNVIKETSEVNSKQLLTFILFFLDSNAKESELTSPFSKEIEQKWFENLNKIKRKIKKKSIIQQVDFTPNRKNDHKQNEKIKQLISKILINKDEAKAKFNENNEDQAIHSIYTRLNPQTSKDKEIEFKQSIGSRYDKIEEESSNINSDSIISSDLSEGGPTSYNKRLQTRQHNKINQEINLNFSESVENRENIQAYKPKDKEWSKLGTFVYNLYTDKLNFNQSDKALKDSKSNERSLRRDGLHSSQGTLQFYENMLGKTIHSAKKAYNDCKKDLRKQFVETDLLSTSAGLTNHKWMRYNDSAPRVNIFSLHDRDMYRDIGCIYWNQMPLTARKTYRNNLRRKTIMLSKSRKGDSSQREL